MQQIKENARIQIVNIFIGNPAISEIMWLVISEHVINKEILHLDMMYSVGVLFNGDKMNANKYVYVVTSVEIRRSWNSAHACLTC